MQFRPGRRTADRYAKPSSDLPASTPLGLWALLADRSIPPRQPTSTRPVLIGVWLEGSDLTAADLRRANLDHAHLAGVNLSRATLQGANLHRADLSHEPYSKPYY